MSYRPHATKFFLTFLTLLIFLAACAAPVPINSPAPQETHAGADGTPAPQETAPPLDNSTPTAPAEPAPIAAQPRILVVGNLPEQAQTSLAQLAAAEGLRVQTQLTLQPADLTTETRLVILADLPEGLAALLTAAPETPFWAINLSVDVAAPNLLPLQTEIAPDKRGFWAGYIAAILTEDWRVGALVLADAEGKALRDGFVNGGKYFCGLCRSMYPPFAAYPLYVEVPFDSNDEARIAAANLLLEQGVTTVFLGTGIATEALVNHLSASEVVTLGSESPASGENPFWAATLQFNAASALEAQWQAWQSGETIVPAAALTLTDVNPDLFSPGKQQRALAILPDLLAGYLQTETLP